MINLYNEDCLEGMSRIPDGSVDAAICDPPFGTTDAPWDKRLPFEPFWAQILRVTKLNAAMVFFSQMPFGSDLIQSQRKLFRYEWIWRKNIGLGFLNANRMPLRCHENLLVFYRKLPTYNPQFTEGKPYPAFFTENDNGANYAKSFGCHYGSDGRRYPLDVQSFSQVKETHPTQKPVDLLEYLIRTYTDAGETVLDATMGSGSTGVAAVNTGRNFIGFETEERFFKIAQERINKALAEKEQALF